MSFRVHMRLAVVARHPTQHLASFDRMAVEKMLREAIPGVDSRHSVRPERRGDHPCQRRSASGAIPPESDCCASCPVSPIPELLRKWIQVIPIPSGVAGSLPPRTTGCKKRSVRERVAECPKIRTPLSTEDFLPSHQVDRFAGSRVVSIRFDEIPIDRHPGIITCRSVFGSGQLRDCRRVVRRFDLDSFLHRR